ncbi:hypothetical protein FXO38_36599, partial [Capsicum annuum]
MAYSSVSSNTDNFTRDIREFDLIGEAVEDHQLSEDNITEDGEEESMPLVVREEEESEEENEQSEEIPMKEGSSDGNGDFEGFFEIKPTEQNKYSEDADDVEDKDKEEPLSLMAREEEMNEVLRQSKYPQTLHSSLLL